MLLRFGVCSLCVACGCGWWAARTVRRVLLPEFVSSRWVLTRCSYSHFSSAVVSGGSVAGASQGCFVVCWAGFAHQRRLKGCSGR